MDFDQLVQSKLVDESAIRATGEKSSEVIGNDTKSQPMHWLFVSCERWSGAIYAAKVSKKHAKTLRQNRFKSQSYRFQAQTDQDQINNSRNWNY
jgi:hypothetical protein